MIEIEQTIPLAGFDPGGEPEILVMSDGSLVVSFAFMPPSFIDDPGERRSLGDYGDFAGEMERAIGTSVLWEDRESFRIDDPGEDTIERIEQFLSEYHR